jgi:adenylate kinase family enzyme
VRDIIILGGPNGAGKTTAARALVPEELHGCPRARPLDDNREGNAMTELTPQEILDAIQRGWRNRRADLQKTKAGRRRSPRRRNNQSILLANRSPAARGRDT